MVQQVLVVCVADEAEAVVVAVAVDFDDSTVADDKPVVAENFVVADEQNVAEIEGPFQVLKDVEKRWELEILALYLVYKQVENSEWNA